MPREGRFVEVITALLQDFFGPEDISIISPKEYYENGKKIGEIDVLMAARIGTTTVVTGIECRDRAGSGPQGADWIREISGKKDQFHLNKMIAISTSGFTEPAISTAKKFGIDLLSLDSAEEYFVDEWEINVAIPIMNSYSYTQQQGTLRFATNPIRSIDDFSKDVQLYDQELEEFITLQEFYDKAVHKIVQEIPPVSIQSTFEREIRIDSPIPLQIKGVSTLLIELEIPVTINVEPTKTTLRALFDIETKKTIAMIGINRLNFGSDEVVSLQFAREISNSSGETHLRVYLLNEQFTPMTISYQNSVSGKYLQFEFYYKQD